MRTKEETQTMRKRNMKLFPSYKMLAWDYLFYYAIDFLFLTQVKGLDASDVVLLTSIQAIFGILVQIPANVIVEFFGRKNSTIIGNVLNCIYLIMFMLGGSLFDFAIAKFISSFAKSIKNIAEPSLLNESIPPTKNKSAIFAKIAGKGATGYYAISAASKVAGGFLFTINGYIPLICSLAVTIFVTILSTCYIEPVEKETKRTRNEISVRKQIKDIGDGFKFILKSERLKALMVSSALISSLLVILIDYHTSLLKDINLTSTVIGTVSAVMSIVSAYAAKKQNDFHNKFHNKTIITIALMMSISTIIAGVAGIDASGNIGLIAVVVAMLLIARFAHGMHCTIEDRYLRNFANEKIDTKIFAVKNIFVYSTRAIFGLIASFLLGKMSTAISMIVVGIVFTIIFILMYEYMKTRVGLKPEEYSAEERKYDELVVR